MHKPQNKQCTNRCHSAEGELRFSPTRSRENTRCVTVRGWQQCGTLTHLSPPPGSERGWQHSPQPAARLAIRGEGAVADAAEGVAGLQLGLLALRGGLSLLPLAEELLERLELACLFLVCRRQERAAGLREAAGEASGARRGSGLRAGAGSKSEEAAARSGPALAMEMPGCNLLWTRHTDKAAFKPVLLALRICRQTFG